MIEIHECAWVKHLSKYRLSYASEVIEEAEALLIFKKYKGANNRAYYAVFHLMRAILALEGFDSRKHSGIIARFNEYYIKTSIFDKTLGKEINEMSIIRNRSDYDDFFIATREQAETGIKNAKHFYVVAKKYIEEKIDE